MNYTEFRQSILSKNKHHRFSNSYGVYDAYKYYRKNKPKEDKYILSESQYFSIVRNINLLVMKDLSLGKEFRLPLFLGKLELRKYNTKVELIDGKIKTNRPIDWDSTLKLWYEDSQAHKNKTLIKREEKEIFRLFYNRSLAIYKNQVYFQFNFNNKLKKQLAKNIKEGLVDAYKM